MITPLLEKAIAQGKATYKKYTHAFSSFGMLQIPKGITVIIVDVKWNQFINPYKRAMRWSEFFRYSEYQLKIDGNKSLNYMQFRNEFKWKITDPTFVLNLNDTIDPMVISDSFVPDQSLPIIQDVFFICQEFIKLTITRNAFGYNVPATNFGTVNNRFANEKNIPVGIANGNVLKTITLEAESGQTFDYVPPGNGAGDVSNPTQYNTEGYASLIDDFGLLQDPSAAYGPFIFPYYPLVEFGIVTINSNDFDRLANS